jgi:low affinity Fe/Cu permease
MQRNLEGFTHRFVRLAGSATGFVTAVLSIIAWLFAGYWFGFSNNWQNAIQIYIGILTFLMIFLIQRSQTKEIATLQLKLDELIVVTHPANNKLINARDLSEREIREAHEMHREAVKKDQYP